MPGRHDHSNTALIAELLNPRVVARRCGGAGGRLSAAALLEEAQQQPGQQGDGYQLGEPTQQPEGNAEPAEAVPGPEATVLVAVVAGRTVPQRRAGAPLRALSEELRRPAALTLGEAPAGAVGRLAGLGGDGRLDDGRCRGRPVGDDEPCGQQADTENGKQRQASQRQRQPDEPVP